MQDMLPPEKIPTSNGDQNHMDTTFNTLWQRAQAYIEKKEYLQARDILRDILIQCKNLSREKRSEVLVLAARVSYWLGDHGTAKEDCNTALQLNPNNSSAHIILGKIATNEYYFSKALGHFASVDQPDGEVDIALCRLYLRLRNPSKARSHLSRAGQLISTTSPDYKVFNAYIELLQGNSDYAVGAVLALINDVRNTPELDLTIAEILVIAGNFAAAETLLNNLQKTMPGNGDVYGLLAQCSFLKSNFNKSQSEVQRAISLNPQNLFAMTVNMKNAIREGRYDDAIDMGQKILKLAPEYPLAHANLGDAYFSKGDYDAARSEYEASNGKKATKTKGSMLRAARLSYMKEDYAEARKILETLLDDTNIIYDDAICDLHAIYGILGLKNEQDKLIAKMEVRRAFSHRIDATLAKLAQSQ